MTEIRGRLGRLLACHVIQREGPQPHPGMLHIRTRAAPAAWWPVTADVQPIADPFPTGPAGSHYLDTRTGSAGSG
jgi:hypothetical protein